MKKISKIELEEMKKEEKKKVSKTIKVSKTKKSKSGVYASEGIKSQNIKKMKNLKTNIKKSYNTNEFKSIVRKGIDDNMKNVHFEPYLEHLDNLNDSVKEAFKKPIGLYDPYGENINPFTLKPYENLYQNKIERYRAGPLKGQEYPQTYTNFAYIWSSIVIYKKLDELINKIRDNQVLLMSSGTGSGKTLLTPRAAMQAFNYQKKVIVTIPKKFICFDAARTAALASDVRLGNEVGYYYSGKAEHNENTKLFYTTTGSLISKISRADPYLEEYDCVIIDEAHERSVETDMLLFYLKKACMKRRDLKLIIMSATIELDKFRNYFPNGTHMENSMVNRNLNNITNAKFKFGEIDVGGEKLYDVAISYSDKPIDKFEWKKKAAEKAVEYLKTTQEGDIMIFVASISEGRQICDEINRFTRNDNSIVPFCTYISSGSSEDDKAFAKGNKSWESHPNYNPNRPYTRKIILATNAAESSITIDSVVYVIDSGYLYEDSYFPDVGARSLIPERISKASAKQRAGRAGRVSNGFCYRLYTETEFNAFHDFPIPDIQKKDLSSFMLDMMHLPYIDNIGQIKDKVFKYLIEPPTDVFFDSAIHLLFSLGAINSDSRDAVKTPVGDALTIFRKIPLPLAKAIVASHYYKCKYDVIPIILLFMELDGRIENVFEDYRPKKGINDFQYKRELAEHESKKKKFLNDNGDFMTLYKIYNSFNDFQRGYGNGNIKLSKNEINKWFKDNGIIKKIFVDRDGNNKIKNDMFKVVRALNLVVEDQELKKKFFENKMMMKNNNKKMNSNKMNNVKLNKKINEVIFDNETSILDMDLETTAESNIMNNSVTMMMGGELKPYEFNYFPGLIPFEDKEDNIMASLYTGLIVNSAKPIASSKDLFTTIFPIKRTLCKFDRNTTLKSRGKPSIVFYGELFKQSHEQPILKLNFVNKVPKKVYDQVLEIFPEAKNEFSRKNKTITYEKKKQSGRTHGRSRSRSQGRRSQGRRR